MAFLSVGTVFEYTPRRTQKDSLTRLTVKLRVVLSCDCHGCHFLEGRGKCSKPHTFACVATGRTDRNTVKFINVTYAVTPVVTPGVKPVSSFKRLCFQDVSDAASCFQDIPDEIIDQMEDL